MIANFCTRAFWNTKPSLNRIKNQYIRGNQINAENKKYQKQLVRYGEMSRQDVYKTCFDYLHKLSVEEALKSNNPLLQALAVIDKRLGKRRISRIDKNTLHPLAERLFTERMLHEERKYS